jgi:hypothetical protein
MAVMDKIGKRRKYEGSSRGLLRIAYLPWLLVVPMNDSMDGEALSKCKAVGTNIQENK